MSFLRPTSRLARLPLVLAMLALVLAQALGAWHRIRHGTGGAAPAGIVAQAVRDAGHAHVNAHANAHSAVLAHAHVHDAYTHEAGSETCRLLDAMGQAGIPPAAPCDLPPAPATAVALPRTHAVVVADAAAFDARGPPAAH